MKHRQSFVGRHLGGVQSARELLQLVCQPVQFVFVGTGKTYAQQAYDGIEPRW
ncbi:hypothetical protein KCH_12740 [Kitasatospora cheerisanensis KCTC 2395]|uniref:Uncharacterized protein n=1 Tax=Kitasatospora cheerisanensis KCTC 2395 TaxID=1348663 RepID=A0A066Z4Q0_9ACTN|nr:hypothetical protein KCH_12740 [Kitasatospora cheerisanensis KCTC 2395]